MFFQIVNTKGTLLATTQQKPLLNAVDIQKGGTSRVWRGDFQIRGGLKTQYFLTVKGSRQQEMAIVVKLGISPQSGEIVAK